MSDPLNSASWQGRFNAPFVARLTERGGDDDGAPVYAWTEQVYDPEAGEYVDGDPTREGTLTDRPAREVNGAAVDVPEGGLLVWLRFRSMDEDSEGESYEFHAGLGGGAAVCRCTSATPDGDGYCAGVAVTYDPDALDWTDGDAVLLLPLNGETLTAGDRYDCVPLGRDPDSGDRVYAPATQGDGTAGAGAAAVRVTGGGSPVWDGVLVTYDAGSGAWTDGAAVQVVPLSGTLLSAGQRYAAVPVSGGLWGATGFADATRSGLLRGDGFDQAVAGWHQIHLYDVKVANGLEFRKDHDSPAGGGFHDTAEQRVFYTVSDYSGSSAGGDLAGDLAFWAKNINTVAAASAAPVFRLFSGGNPDSRAEVARAGTTDGQGIGMFLGNYVVGGVTVGTDCFYVGTHYGQTTTAIGLTFTGGILTGGTVSISVGSVTGAAPLASPALTGTPTAPTATAGTNTTQIATTAFVATATASLAPLASPTFTGTPAVPTAAPGTNTTQAASTAFVATAVGSAAPAATQALAMTWMGY